MSQLNKTRGRLAALRKRLQPKGEGVPALALVVLVGVISAAVEGYRHDH